MIQHHILRVVTAAIAAVLALGAPAAASAAAQEAEQAGGPLHYAGATSTVIGMIAGELPAATPRAPVDMWIWYFRSDVLDAGGVVYDASAQRVRVDCQAGSMQRQWLELYREGRAVRSISAVAEAQVPAPGGLQAMIVADICQPRQRQTQPATFPDHRAARAAATSHFARTGS